MTSLEKLRQTTAEQVQLCNDPDLLDLILKLLVAQGGNQLLDHSIAVGG
jgi:hypothetical protein